MFKIVNKDQNCDPLNFILVQISSENDIYSELTMHKDVYHLFVKHTLIVISETNAFSDNSAWWKMSLFFLNLQFLKGALDKFNIIPNFFPKKVGIFIPLGVLAWVKTACPVLRSRLTYFRRNMNISSISYFSKSTSINTQCSSLWGTLKMMLFTKYLIKWKCIGRISWNFRYWFDYKSSIELDIKR